MADISKYEANVRKYDPSATDAHIEKLVKHLGIALRNKDSSLVSCGDEEEKMRVVKGFCAKRMGMSTDEGKAAVDAVCATMKEDRMKSRVTFYYLIAKNAGNLDI